MMLLALIMGSLILCAGVLSYSVTLMALGCLVFLGAWCEFKPHVLRMQRSGHAIIDHSNGAWTVVALDGAYWVAHFGEDWVRQYHSTWAFGRGRDRVWFYEPKEAHHGR